MMVLLAGIQAGGLAIRLENANMSKGLKITFALPGSGHNPVGGFKVVYEYANSLSRLGHHVTIVHPALLSAAPRSSEMIASTLRFAYRKGVRSYEPTGWFSIDPSVRLLWVPSLAPRHIPDGDVIVATAWQTAEWIAEYPRSKGRRFYLIQHLETWSGSEDRVCKTWKLPLVKIVIAKWLQEIAESLGEASLYIPNGLDFDKFSLYVPPEQRSPLKALMLYHHLDWKGSGDGLGALSLARKEVPDLTVALFGVSPPPSGLPPWIQYHRRPDQKFLHRLYNEASIFVAPSWAEGWPLPPAEAMMCGAALAATDIGGHREYARHEETALLSPAKSPTALAENIVRLVRNNGSRTKMAARGHAHMQQFTWKRATEKMEGLLRNGGEG
jgi:glycosyltransferase involved in cell wall biosynthesis